MQRLKRRLKQLVRGPKEHVFIGVPCVNEHLHVGVHRFLLWTHWLNMEREAPWRFSHAIVTGKHDVDYCRNVICGQFLQSDAARLIMLDDDMIPGEQAIALLHSKADICAPRMFAIKRDPSNHEPRLEFCSYKYDPTGTTQRFHSIIPAVGTGEVEVDAVGTGFIIIRRRVIEDRRMWTVAPFDWYGKPIDVTQPIEDEFAPPVFRTVRSPNGRHFRGEDLDFCLRAKQLGYRITAHVGLACGHAKLVNLDDLAIFANRAIERFARAHGAPAEAAIKPEGGNGDAALGALVAGAGCAGMPEVRLPGIVGGSPGPDVSAGGVGRAGGPAAG